MAAYLCNRNCPIKTLDLSENVFKEDWLALLGDGLMKN